MANIDFVILLPMNFEWARRRASLQRPLAKDFNRNLVPLLSNAWTLRKIFIVLTNHSNNASAGTFVFTFGQI